MLRFGLQVTFGAWSPLAEASPLAPTAPGVFQVRQASGLQDYPRGKSAMVHYAAAANLSVAIAEFANAHPDAAWLCRHSEQDLSAEVASAQLDRLLQLFESRFGTAPRLADASVIG